MLHDRKRTYGPSNLIFSLLPRGRQYARGRECVVRMQFFEPHILCPVLGKVVHDRKENTVRRTACSLLCIAGSRMQEAENVRFFEPHILRFVFWEIVSDSKKTLGSKNLICLLFYGSWYIAGRECGVLRTPRSLSRFMGVGTRQEEKRGVLRTPRFSLLSLLFYGSQYATGRERGVLRTPRSLSCLS